MPKVELRDKESQQQLLRRFRTKVTRSGVLGQLRKKRWFVSKSERRRLEKKKSIQRIRRRARKTQSE
ncbi:MAG: 30S ribosomal protein S21 [Anaerolineales bacterium]|nr:30S ribosomal protein S21 [Anaerolineales bacterium]